MAGGMVRSGVLRTETAVDPWENEEAELWLKKGNKSGWEKNKMNEKNSEYFERRVLFCSCARGRLRAPWREKFRVEYDMWWGNRSKPTKHQPPT